MGVDAGSIGCQRGSDRSQRGKRFPTYGKAGEVQGVDGLGFADHSGDGLAPEPGLNFGKHRLVGKPRNHAVAILAGNILRGQHANDSRMCSHESVKIAEAEACAMGKDSGLP